MSEASVYRGFVTPHHPRTDEISAMAIYEFKEMGRLGLNQPPVLDIKFWGKPDCSFDDLERLITDSYLPIEIGEMRYQTAGASSATEALAQTLGWHPLDRTVGEHKLIEILARRNQSGYMNQFYMSLPRILKDVYHLMECSEVEIVNRFKDVVLAFLAYENAEDPGVTEIPDELGDLTKATEKCQLAPLTPGRYLRDLCFIGEPPDQIREKVSFWITAWERFQFEFKNAQQNWPQDDAKMGFSILGLPAAAIESTNLFYPKIVFNNQQPGNIFLLITRNPNTGHAAIMVRGKKNTSSLHRELEMREPGIWYHHGATGHLLNGGSEFPDVPPTSLKLSEIASLATQFPPR